MLTHIDLFSGIGGFALASQWAGFRTVAFCEIELYCQEILKKKFEAVMADADSKRRQQKRRGPSRNEKTHGRTGWDGSKSNSNNIPTSNGESRPPKLFSDIRSFPASRYCMGEQGGCPCGCLGFKLMAPAKVNPFVTAEHYLADRKRTWTGD